MTTARQDVLRSLRAVWRRMLAQTFLTTLGRCALLLGALLVSVGALRRAMLAEPPWDSQFALWAGAGTLALTLAITLARRGTLRQGAAAIDRLGQTHDRFVTALAFSGSEAAPELRKLALRECATFIRGGDFARLVRLRLPREVPYLVVPAIALALLQWEARVTFRNRDAEAGRAREQVEETASELEKLARETEKAHDQSRTEDLRRLAQELKHSAQQLRAEATNSEAAEKASLRELSGLEQLVKELQKDHGAPSPEELRELAKALGQSEPTKDAAASLKAGEMAKAAEQLEQALKELSERKEQRTQEQIEQALKEALARLAQQRQLSDALQKLAQKLQQPGANGQASQLSQALADLLKKLQPRAGQQAKPGSPQNQQSLQNLLAALQNMKFGNGKADDGNSPSPPGGKGGLVTMQSFAQNPSGSPAGEPQFPSGSPGSEHDLGTTASPFGKEKGDSGRNATPQALSGSLGEGETLQQFMPGANDTSKSRRRYQELYDAMAPAAQDAVVQENIPLGSRFFIKRYFEAIRPRE